jgi:phage shock protein C
MNDHKKLYRSSTNKVISGVFGGLGEYLNIDPTILRLAYVLLAIMTGFFPAFVAYIIAVVIIPEQPFVRAGGSHMKEDVKDAEYTETKAPSHEEKKDPPPASAGRAQAGEPKAEEKKSE